MKIHRLHKGDWHHWTCGRCEGYQDQQSVGEDGVAEDQDQDQPRSAAGTTTPPLLLEKNVSACLALTSIFLSLLATGKRPSAFTPSKPSAITPAQTTRAMAE